MKLRMIFSGVLSRFRAFSGPETQYFKKSLKYEYSCICNTDSRSFREKSPKWNFVGKYFQVFWVVCAYFQVLKHNIKKLFNYIYIHNLKFCWNIDEFSNFFLMSGNLHVSIWKGSDSSEWFSHNLKLWNPILKRLCNYDIIYI